MKYCSLIIFLVLLSCGKQEDVLLPKSNVTIVSNIEDHSPIYIFFRTNGKDTLVEVNRKNSIISTNWILNIDKRLPLRLVIPEVMKLQDKKRKEVAHKNELAENYYSYADSIGKNMAFLPFTNVYYTIGEPAAGDMIIRFKKRNNLVLVDDEKIQKKELVSYVYSISHIVQPRIFLVFDKNMSYEEYIQAKILVRKFDSYNDEAPKEFIN
jgi:biopolymer transport protein ExbD